MKLLLSIHEIKLAGKLIDALYDKQNHNLYYFIENINEALFYSFDITFTSEILTF